MTLAESVLEISFPPLEGDVPAENAIASLKQMIPRLKDKPERQMAFLLEVLTHTPYLTEDQAALMHPDVGIAALDLVQHIPEDNRKDIFTRVLNNASPHWRDRDEAEKGNKYAGWQVEVCTAALRNIQYLKPEDRRKLMEDIIEKTKHQNRYNAPLLKVATEEAFPHLGLSIDQIELLTREYLNRAATPPGPLNATYGAGV